MGQRARGWTFLLSYLFATAAGLFVVGYPHSLFVAIFGTFMVAAAASLVFFAISLCALLIRTIKGRS